MRTHFLLAGPYRLRGEGSYKINIREMSEVGTFIASTVKIKPIHLINSKTESYKLLTLDFLIVVEEKTSDGGRHKVVFSSHHSHFSLFAFSRISHMHLL
jgi:hypothetical protein